MQTKDTQHCSLQHNKDSMEEYENGTDLTIVIIEKYTPTKVNSQRKDNYDFLSLIVLCFITDKRIVIIKCIIIKQGEEKEKLCCCHSSCYVMMVLKFPFIIIIIS